MKKFRLIFYLLITAVIFAFFLFNKYGILKYIALNNQKNQLEEQIKNVQHENDKLKAEIDSLKYEDIKIEKVAREKYNMKKKGEKVFKVKKNKILLRKN